MFYSTNIAYTFIAGVVFWELLSRMASCSYVEDKFVTPQSTTPEGPKALIKFMKRLIEDSPENRPKIVSILYRLDKAARQLERGKTLRGHFQALFG